MKDIKVESRESPKQVQLSKQEYSEKERHTMIEKAAYYGACARGFDKGDALGDWLVAEQRIEAALAS